MIKVEGGKVIEIERGAENISVPTFVSSIGPHACIFASILSLHLEETQITVIEEYAFSNCHFLKEIKFPSSLERICEGAFSNCMNVEQVSFPPDSKLRIICKKAFNCCSRINTFEFPPLLELVEEEAFDYCIKLKHFDFRNTKVSVFKKNLNIYIKMVTLSFPPTASVDSITRNSINIIEVDESHPVVRRDGCGFYIANNTVIQVNKNSTHLLIRRCYERISKFCFSYSNIVAVTIPSSVVTISRCAFHNINQLQRIRFAKDSRLEKIGESAFTGCLIKRVVFPKSLKVIKKNAFELCQSLEQVVFPPDSELERIESPFSCSKVKRLSLPPSVKEIIGVCYSMYDLKEIYVNNDIFESNEEGTAIFTKDGSELISVINTLKDFEIPEGVRVIKKGALDIYLTNGHIVIPSSVEVIEEKVFSLTSSIESIEFSAGSKLKSLGFESLPRLRSLIINNENFITNESGVVMSMNPRGIVFVPRELTELEVDSDVEVIFSNAFFESNIVSLKLPKSLKKIYNSAFINSNISDLTFEDGTELDFIDEFAFSDTEIKHLKLPPIVGDMRNRGIYIACDVIELPPKLDSQYVKGLSINAYSEQRVILPESSAKTASTMFFGRQTSIEIIED